MQWKKRAVLFTLVLYFSLMSLHLSAADGDSWKDAIFLRPDDDVTFTIPASNAVKWYRISLGQDEAMWLTIRGEEETFPALRYEIYAGRDLEETIVEALQYSMPASPIRSRKVIDYLPEAKGDYYVKFYGDTNISPLHLRLSVIPPDHNGNNNTWQNATPFIANERMSLTTRANNDVNWFKLTVPSPVNAISLTIRGETETFAPLRYEIHSGANLEETIIKALDYSMHASPIRSRKVIDYMPSEPGDYYIRFSGDTNLDPLYITSNLGFEGEATPPPSEPSQPISEPSEPAKPIEEPSQPIPDDPKPTDEPTQEFHLNAVPISVGVHLTWDNLEKGMGYRVYRSESAGNQGISVTDFYITDNEFIDVNVEKDQMYYYTVRQVISEAKVDGTAEELSHAAKQISVRTLETIHDDDPSGGEKKVILMTVNDAYMSVQGIRTEVDPGRATTPVIVSGRTMVPIRAIVESMGGSISFDDGTRCVTMSYGTQIVEMILDDLLIKVNGVEQKVDVPAAVINERTMVPVRFAGENLGCQVEWINSTQQIVVVYR